MIVALDLDDTLYPEITYVKSGFRAVAHELQRAHGVPAPESMLVLARSLEERGRGSQFDDLLRHWNLATRTGVRHLVAVYRRHDPELTLPEESRRVLTDLSARWPLYLVTDGNHLVQARKVRALGIEGFFEHCYFTNRYGRKSAKPSTRVFELMLRRENAQPSDLVYVGDNPSKDFVGVRRLGGRTVRVMTGEHRNVVAARGYEADAQVATIGALPELLLTF